jgi:hypothetical protein
MPYRPNLTGFVLRDRDGFCQIAELDANTGLPKGIRLGTELKTSVVGLKKGEKLELIVLVDMSHRPDKFAAIAEVLPGALFECSIAKPKQAVQSKERK